MGRRLRAATRVGLGSPDRGDDMAIPDSLADRRAPWSPRRKPRKTEKMCGLKSGSSPRGGGGHARGALGKDSGGGCLSVGPRVRMESRVPGAAGFWPGTPVGAQGSPGPRGEPGKSDVFAVHFEDFTAVPRKVRARGWPAPTPRPLRGLHGFGRRAGFPGRPRGEPGSRGGSPGPRGEPGKKAFSLSTLGRFYTAAPEVSLEAGPRHPPPAWLGPALGAWPNLG